MSRHLRSIISLDIAKISKQPIPRSTLVECIAEKKFHHGRDPPVFQRLRIEAQVPSLFAKSSNDIRFMVAVFVRYCIIACNECLVTIYLQASHDQTVSRSAQLLCLPVRGCVWLNKYTLSLRNVHGSNLHHLQGTERIESRKRRLNMGWLNGKS
jgi:hypothetical protein